LNSPAPDRSVPLPTSLDNATGTGPGDFLPSPTGWQATYFALHEWIGFAWYKFR
jgi:hypothetical protein